MNEEYDSSDKAKMQNALKQKARNARKSKTLTQEEVDRIKKVLPEFNITAREKKR